MSEIRQAVILAAGLGTRLRPHTLETPKPLLPVAGRPILEWNIGQLPPPIEEVILVVGYLKEKIRAHFGDHWQGRKISYVEQKELKGTGHAVHQCQLILDEKFMVMNGDDLYAAADVIAALEHERAMLVKETDISGRFGALRTDAAGRLVAIDEQATSESNALVNAGLYVLDRRFFDYPLVPIRGGAEFGLPQTLVLVAQDHPVDVVRAGFWVPIGFPEDLTKATELLLKFRR